MIKSHIFESGFSGISYLDMWDTKLSGKDYSPVKGLYHFISQVVSGVNCFRTPVFTSFPQKKITYCIAIRRTLILKKLLLSNYIFYSALL